MVYSQFFLVDFVRERNEMNVAALEASMHANAIGTTDQIIVIAVGPEEYHVAEGNHRVAAMMRNPFVKEIRAVVLFPPEGK